jgi:hypothetical protein
MPRTKRSTNDSTADCAVGMAEGQSMSPDRELPADLELPECGGSVAVFKQFGRDRGTRRTSSHDQSIRNAVAPSLGHPELCGASDHQCGDGGGQFHDSEPQAQRTGAAEFWNAPQKLIHEL